jgi:hypothetical protein
MTTLMNSHAVVYSDCYGPSAHGGDICRGINAHCVCGWHAEFVNDRAAHAAADRHKKEVK